MKKIRKIISSLLVSTSLLTLNPIGIYATEATDSVVSNAESNSTVDTAETAVSVTGIKLDNKNLIINQGDVITLNETILPSTASNKEVTWKSSNTDVAKVSSSGEVKAVTEGNAIITCTANDGSGKSTKCKVTVYYSYYNKLKLLNNDNSIIQLYSNDNYDSDKMVKQLENKKTYYAKTSSDKISINIKDLDQDYVKVFKPTSYSISGEVKTATLLNKDDISLSSGITTLIVRIYSEEPNSKIKYKDDHNNILDQYKIKVELNQ